MSLDSESLKTTLLPSPTRCLQLINDLLPRIANKKTQELLEELKQSHDKISAIPITVEEFVNLTQHLVECADKMDDYDIRYDHIIAMYALMAEHGIRISDDDNTSKFMLTQSSSTLKTTLQVSEDKVADNTARFAKELDEQVPRLHTKIADTMTQVRIMYKDKRFAHLTMFGVYIKYDVFYDVGFLHWN